MVFSQEVTRMERASGEQVCCWGLREVAKALECSCSCLFLSLLCSLSRTPQPPEVLVSSGSRIHVFIHSVPVGTRGTDSRLWAWRGLPPTLQSPVNSAEVRQALLSDDYTSGNKHSTDVFSNIITNLFATRHPWRVTVRREC